MIFNGIIQIHLMLKGIKDYFIYKIIFIPCENYDIIDLMAIKNIKNNFNVESLYFDLIPIDINLLSLKEIIVIKKYILIII